MNSLYSIILCVVLFSTFFFAEAAVENNGPYDDFEAKEILFPSKEYPKHFFEHDILNKPGKTSTLVINARQIKTNQNTAFFILLVLTLLIAITKNVTGRNYQNIWRSLSSVTISKQIYYDQKIGVQFSYLLLNIVFLISFSLWLFYLLPLLGITLNKAGISVFLWILGIIVLLFLSKTLLIRIMALIFPFGSSLRLFSFNCWQIYKATGILLIPFSLLIAFSTPEVSAISAYISIVIVFLVIAMRVIKGLIIGKNYILTEKKLFFLYICTLEIVPVILFIKILQNAQLI